MTWYAAHTIMAFKYTEHEQEDFPVWENIYLVEAETDDQAYQKAEVYARQFEGDSDKTLTVNNKPATLTFVGIRKLISVSNMNSETDDYNLPGDGAEISYSSFVLKSEADINKLILGESVRVMYEE